MRARILIAVAMLTGCSALPSNRGSAVMDIPNITIAAGAPYYDSQELARDAAMRALRRFSAPWEYSGVIITTPDNKYQVSVPVTIRDGARSAFSMSPDIKSRLAATFHSHPAIGGVRSNVLSKEDLQVVKQLGVPMYVLDKGSNKVLTQLPKPATTPVKVLK